MERYDPQAIEAKWQQVWAAEEPFHVPTPDLDELHPERRKSYVVEMLPYPSGDLHMGHTLNYTIGDVITHVQRRTRRAGAAPDGLRRVRPACRERRDQGRRAPARRHRAQHRVDPRADAPHGLGDRLGARDLDARSRVLPLDPMAVPALLRARARLPQGGAGQLVPERPDGARERAGDRRPLRALRRGGGGQEPDAVVLPDHATTPTSCWTRWTCSSTGRSAC